MGSAAAKWVAQMSEGKVALVGVQEPENREHGEIFGAWHDKGRITWMLDTNDCWRLLGEKSLSRYRYIEESSGVSFYQEVGFLSLVDEDFNEKEDLENTVEILRQSSYNCDFLDSSNAARKFPYLNISEGKFGYHQQDYSGYINPREMVKAQKVIAASNGCEMLQEAVKDITKEDDKYCLLLSSGETIKSEKVVLAIGAYLNISKLLNNFFKEEVNLTLATQTVAYLKVPEEEAMRLMKMPSMETTYIKGALDGTYILPPIRYPDGKFYLKLGHHDNFEGVVETGEDVLDWYRRGTGVEEAVTELADFLQDLIPNLIVDAVSSGCCITSNTVSKDAPYIEEVQQGLYVVAGGCGYGAKSCDEIGRITAVLVVEGRWDSDIEQHRMKVVWRKKK